MIGSMISSSHLEAEMKSCSQSSLYPLYTHSVRSSFRRRSLTLPPVFGQPQESPSLRSLHGSFFYVQGCLSSRHSQSPSLPSWDSCFCWWDCSIVRFDLVTFVLSCTSFPFSSAIVLRYYVGGSTLIVVMSFLTFL